MNTKTLIYIGAFIGSSIGGAIPLLWDGGLFSFSSVFLSGAGALMGIWAGYKVSRYL